MHAAEFLTTVQNGVIQLPENQQAWNGKKLRVILLEESHQLELDHLSTAKDNADFFQLAGIWQNRDIDLSIIRNQAWRENNL